MTYTITERMMRDKLGLAYNPDAYVEGQHYVKRKAFKGERRMYRKDIFEMMDGLGKSPVEQPVEQSVTVGEWRGVDEPKEPVSVVSVAGTGEYECKVTRIYPNTRIVETDKGKVFAGGKGYGLKRNQIILVKDGVMISSKPRKGW